MRRWKELDVVETIYEADHEEVEEEEEEEEEEDDDAFSNPPLSSFTFSPADTSPSVNLSSATSTPLQIIVDEWSIAAGYKPNVVIRVHGHCFHLHREPMTSRSRYLRRRLMKANDVSVCPPFNIMVETFADVARFCYGWAPLLTPLNVAAVRAAAEWLEMDEDGGAGGGSLARRTEDFFRQVIDGDAESAEEVLRCCIGLLPAAVELAATMAARCLEVLAASADGGFLRGEWVADLMEVPPELFGWVAESMARWSLHDHDHLYLIVDQYLELHEKKQKISDEEKMDICGAIECRKLSHELRLHLVQNSRLPLRFMLKAMFLSRHPSIAGSTDSLASNVDDVATLGELLEEDAASRQAANLAVRIESLERDVAGLRRRLRWSEEKRTVMQQSATRAGSFRAAAAPQLLPMLDSGKGKKAAGRGSLRRKLVDGFRSIFGRRG